MTQIYGFRRPGLSAKLLQFNFFWWSVVFSFPLQAWGWGADGHRIVAELAERQLQPKPAAEVRRLLNAESGATMRSVAS